MSTERVTCICDVDGTDPGPTLRWDGQTWRFPSYVRPVEPKVRADYRPLRLTRRGRRLLDLLQFLAISLALAAVLAAAFLYGQHRQSHWCQRHPVQAPSVAACQSGSIG